MTDYKSERDSLIADIEKLRAELLEMDKYDDTQEFQNLLHDIKEKFQSPKCGVENGEKL